MDNRYSTPPPPRPGLLPPNTSFVVPPPSAPWSTRLPPPPFNAASIAPPALHSSTPPPSFSSSSLYSRSLMPSLHSIPPPSMHSAPPPHLHFPPPSFHTSTTALSLPATSLPPTLPSSATTSGLATTLNMATTPLPSATLSSTSTSYPLTSVKMTPMIMDKKSGLPLELEMHREALRQANLLPKLESNRRSSSPDSKRHRSASKSSTPSSSRTPTSRIVAQRLQMVSKNVPTTPKKVSAGSLLLSEVQSHSNLVLQSSPASEYYERDASNPLMLRATTKLLELLDHFDDVCIGNKDEKDEDRKQYVPLTIKRSHCKGCGHGPKGEHLSSSSSSNESSSSDSSSSSSSEDEGKGKDKKKRANGGAKKKKSHRESRNAESQTWLRHRQNQPDRLHSELWENRANELLDGLACRCSLKARREGIRHGFYQGEEDAVKLDVFTNNAVNLKHYRLLISNDQNGKTDKPTVIRHNEHDYVFEGFSLFVPKTMPSLLNLPKVKVRRQSELELSLIEESYPEHLVLSELKLFHVYLFHKLLDLHDWQLPNGDSFLFMPRFVRLVKNRDRNNEVIAKEILSMSHVLDYLTKSREPVVKDEALHSVVNMASEEWLSFLDTLTGSLVSSPTNMVPSAFRVDQVDRMQQGNEYILEFPQVVHKAQRPSQLSFIGNIEYQRKLRETRKLKHLIANVHKQDEEDKKKRLEALEAELKVLRRKQELRKDVTIALSCQHFSRTGIRTDLVYHAMMLPVLVHHIRFHMALRVLEQTINYQFKDRMLLQLALTHPSYKENFGTNPDHARITLANCGPRVVQQPSSETQETLTQKRKNYRAMTRKRGINMLISIMSKFGMTNETNSCVAHNERLEFLGDAVVEFITSVHIFHMFPDLEEGGLATYRAALVQNFNLANLAENIGLQHHMLYAHGSDLCHDSELRHAMANCFEALIGAIFLDGGIEAADKVFARALFPLVKEEDHELMRVWTELEPHPIQSQEPKGDRHWIEKYPLLKDLIKFEESVGIQFTHIRLLARAFTDRSLGFSNLTLGSNQRLEFLGDTVLQLVASDYLYRFFPDHHEGHLSLLRSSIVNNRTQAVVCDDLGLTTFAQFSNPNHEFKTKDKADLLESFLGALYIDKDLEYCQKFAEVCFFPRLTQFIVKQDWNDPKSKLQQCCLTLRSTVNDEPDIPIYKVISVVGPTNTREYTVAVYFRGDRLAQANGRSIQEAEMNAALKALEESRHLFPHLEYQQRVVERSVRRQAMLQRKEQRVQAKNEARQKYMEETRLMRKRLGLDKDEEKTIITKKVKREEDLEDGECSDEAILDKNDCDKIKVEGNLRLVGYSDASSEEPDN